jgi:uncharacterized protein YuzE
MNKTQMTYFKDEDVLHLAVSDAEEAHSVELNDKGELIGIEILEASSFIRDSILESAQAKMLDFSLSHNEAIAADH